MTTSPLLQFITLPGTDEKLRLVPVFATILKLSPEEIKAVQHSIRGESVGRSRSVRADRAAGGERKTFILTPFSVLFSVFSALL